MYYGSLVSDDDDDEEEEVDDDESYPQSADVQVMLGIEEYATRDPCSASEN
jgi:hypothetical protein